MGKKILTFVLALCLALAMIPLTAQAAGADTEWYTKDPSADTFYIGNADELAGLAKLGEWQNYVSFEGKTIVLTADIDLFEYPSWPSMYTSLSNYAFKGTFDGAGHVISNLSGKALFGAVIRSTVKNLYIVNANVSDSGCVAAQVSTDGVIDNCIVSGKISSTGNAAGITGAVNGGTVSNCVAIVPVTTDKGTAGGIAVSMLGNSTISNCAALNDVVSGYKTDNTGRIVGIMSGSNNTLSDNVAFEGMSGNFDSTIKGSNTKNGKDVGKDAVAGILGSWASKVDLPEYLKPDEVVQNLVDVVLAAPSEPFGVVDFQFKASLPANKVNLIEAVFSYYGESFDATAVSLLENAPVNLVRVDAENSKITLVLGVANDGAIAHDEVAFLANITTKVKEGMTPESSALKLDSVKVYSKGEVVECGIVTDLITSAVTYRSPLDVNGDGEINAADLSLVLFYFGATAEDANWDEARFADVNGDGVVDTIDITTLVEAIFGA